jgi:hypothetical protein
MAGMLFKGGTLVGGSGAPPRPGDLLVSGERIVEIDSFEVPADARVSPRFPQWD